MPDDPTTDHAPTAASPRVAAPGEQPGDRIGPYRLLEVIGEGGFGTVWLAEQKEPIARRVALKIIKPGMDSRAVIARFEQERQALALMDHPCIAKVLDAGTTPQGRPFFVMEHVKGSPITSYCDRERLTISQRLELFGAVCSAVQHAHMKGIIHRDLKPSNILVAVAEGGEPRPVVIDFGVAKAIAARLTEKTVYTELGQLIGTPEYMSPEQAEMVETDIDTRSDIYALGVVLYELLTGALPIDPASFRAAGYAAIQKLIREQEPPRPSTRLASLGADAAEVAEARRLAITELAANLRSELEWIPLKAMRKDRVQRYRTAAEMGDDVANYLAHRPLIAGPEATSYRVRKFVRRNRLGVAAGAAVLAALVLGLAGTVWQARAASRERDAAREAEREQARLREAAEAAQHSEAEQRRLAEEQRGLAERNAARADAQAKRAIAASTFMKDMLGAANPRYGNKPGITVREILDQAGAALDGGSLRDQPDVEAAARETLATSYHSLALYDKAESNILIAREKNLALFGEQSEAFADSDFYLTELRYYQGKTAEAEAGFRAAIDRYTRAMGPDSLGVAIACGSLANVLRDSDHPQEAEGLFLRAIEIERKLTGPRCNGVAVKLNNLALLYSKQGRHAEAEALLREALDIHRELKGEEHIEVATTMANLALSLANQNKLAEAAPLGEKAVRIMTASTGEGSLDTVWPLEGMASLLRRLGRVSDALPLNRRALEIRERFLGPDHPLIAVSLGELAVTLNDAGSPEESEPLIRRAIDVAQRSVGPNHPGMIRGWSTLASVLQALRRDGEAVEALQRALAVRRLTGYGGPAGLAVSLAEVGQALVNAGLAADAIPVHREALELRRAITPPSPPNVAASLTQLAAAMSEAGQSEAALPLLSEAMEIRRATEPAGGAGTGNTLSALGKAMLDLGRPDEAERALRRCVEIRGALAQPDSWPLAHARGLLGQALADQGKWQEAEVLVVEGAESIGKASRAPVLRVRQAFERAARFYDAWDRADPGKHHEEMAAQWRARLGSLGDPDPRPVTPR